MIWRLRVSLSSSVFPSLLNRRLGGRLFLFDLLLRIAGLFFLPLFGKTSIVKPKGNQWRDEECVL